MDASRLEAQRQETVSGSESQDGSRMQDARPGHTKKPAGQSQEFNEPDFTARIQGVRSEPDLGEEARMLGQEASGKWSPHLRLPSSAQDPHSYPRMEDDLARNVKRS